MGRLHPIREYRDTHGISVIDLARALDVTRTTVWRWERWRRPVARALWDRVHAVTGIPVELLATASADAPVIAGKAA